MTIKSSTADLSIETFNNACQESIARWTIFEFVSLLTLILLSFYSYSHNHYQYLIQIFFVGSIIYRPMLSYGFGWLGLAAIFTYVVANQWHPVANHKILTTYWLWVLAFMHLASNEQLKHKILVTNARFLVIFTMLGACIQKLLSPSYIDGSFFEMTLLTETYFKFILETFGITPELSHLAKSTIRAIQTPSIKLTVDAVKLPVTPLYSGLAMAVTVWNLGIQFVLEALCLFKAKRVQICFHLLMLFFIHTTYIVAPFIGFGWLICILCYAFSAHIFPKISLAYLLSIVVLGVYESPWRDLIS